MKLPQAYLEKMKNLLKDDFDAYIESLNSKSYVGLRANTLKISPEKLKEILPDEYELEPVEWCKEGFYYSDSQRPAKNPYYNAGLYYIQEPSAMSTAAFLDINEGDRIIDLCAAPGGKSTQAVCKAGKSGLLVTNDISASRCKALVKNIELFGIPNAIITNESPQRLAERFSGYFNKVIADAPCSGEGMFRKDENAAKTWENHKSEVCRQLQREILESADKLLCDGGMIAYSTCTFAPEENEQSVKEFMEKHDNYDIVRLDRPDGFDKGHPEWVNGGKELEDCSRLWPFKIKGEGHFLAILKKRGSTALHELPPIKSVSEKQLEYYREFEKNYLNITFDGYFEIHSSRLINIPYGLNLKGLRVASSGLNMGDIKTKRFEPSQALAMCLKKEDVKNYVDFDEKDERVIRYLKGESFNADCKDGWALVMINGYPLGWGKVQNGRLKNKYLTGWRIS